jgi:hypothetical protein
MAEAPVLCETRRLTLYMTDQITETAVTPLTIDGAHNRALQDPTASPFRLVVDPVMRGNLKRALFALVENHDDQLARHFSEERLSLDSYKEYIELFARSLKETMESREGVDYLLRSCGFDIPIEEINLQPETRWKSV